MAQTIRRVSRKVNTPRIDKGAISRRMDEKAERLREARIKAGFDSATEAAEAFGWGVAGYRHHENGTRSYGADKAKQYGRAFKVKPGWLLGMDGVGKELPVSVNHSEKLIVEGPVAAGVWREPAEGVARMIIDIPPPIAGVTRFGLTVEGFSMDQHYEPGTVLDCVSIYSEGVEPESGDHVIVERIKPDGLRELTVKEFVIRGDVFALIPRSTHPEFKEIVIGSPDRGHIGDDEVRVIGFVVSTISPRALRLMERMGKITRDT